MLNDSNLIINDGQIVFGKWEDEDNIFSYRELIYPKAYFSEISLELVERDDYSVFIDIIYDPNIQKAIDNFALKKIRKLIYQILQPYGTINLSSRKAAQEYLDSLIIKIDSGKMDHLINFS